MDDITNKSTTQTVKAYTVADIAALLQIGRTSAYNLIKEGRFKTVRIGNSIRVSRKSFEEWLEKADN